VTAGVLEMSTWVTFSAFGIDYPLGEDTYTLVQGTSFSAPLVSGLAGLYRSAYPGATTYDFRTALQNTAIDLGDPGYDFYYGYGLADAGAVLDWAPVGGPEQVPEPVTSALFAIGVGVLAWKRRLRAER